MIERMSTGGNPQPRPPKPDPPAGKDGAVVAAFRIDHAAQVAGWVGSADELRLVAPATSPPLTVEKVLAWQRPHVEAKVMMIGGDPAPRAYGELNRMRLDPHHCWLGHIVLDPRIRGRGWGHCFVGRLVAQAVELQRARRVSLIVCPDNAAAIRCYERVGFDRVSEEYHRFGDSGQRQRMLRYELRYC